jgi:hypothetical protein
MSYPVSRVLRFVVLGAAVGMVSAFSFPRAERWIPSAGMSFKLKVTLRHTPTSGRARRATTLLGHGVFAGGMGRVVIDTVDVPSAIRKDDFFIVRDSTNTFWARPSTMTVRRMNAPLVNPIEGISDRLTSGMGSPRSLKVVFDTVAMSEIVNGYDTRHFRITADVVYPVGDRKNVTQKVVLDQWLAKVSVPVMNPFSSRVRGLPDAPAVNGAYREFIRTLAAANRVYGNDVPVRTVTATSYLYGPGLGEDYLQTVDLTDLQPAEVDDREFQMSANYKLQRAARDTAKPPTQESNER